MAAILVMWPGPFIQTFVPPSQGGSTYNLALIGQAVSEEKMFKHCWRQRQRQRTPEQGYTISSPCEPDGSGELTMQNRPLSQQCPKLHNIQWLIKYHRLIRSASLPFKKLQFYLSWPIEFSTKFSWSHAPASDCVNGTRPQCFTLTSGSFHTEDIVLQNIMYLRFIWLDMLHISIKNQI